MTRIRLLASGAFGVAAALYAVLGITVLGGVQEEMVGGVVLAFAASGAVAGFASGPWIRASKTGMESVGRSALVTLGSACVFVVGVLTWFAVAQGMTPEQVQTLPLVPVFVFIASVPAIPLGMLAGWPVWRQRPLACET